MTLTRPGIHDGTQLNEKTQITRHMFTTHDEGPVVFMVGCNMKACDEAIPKRTEAAVNFMVLLVQRELCVMC